MSIKKFIYRIRFFLSHFRKYEHKEHNFIYNKMMNNIFCIKWGDKYDDSYVEKLKKQCEKNCSVDFNFYCFTDNPIRDYDIQLPTYLDKHYDSRQELSFGTGVSVICSVMIM